MLDQSWIAAARAATQAAAIASASGVGRGDNEAADRLAVDAMRASLAGSEEVRWRVVIGEGERDEAPMLYIGEELGQGEVRLDLALDPLEGTSLAAKNAPGALALLAAAREGCLLHAPDVYMEKLAVGPKVPEEAVRLGMAPGEAVGAVAEALSLPAREVSVAVLERERHKELITALRKTGCRVTLFPDGDVAFCLGLSLPHASHHLYLGSGGAPEGVLAAAALSCLGGSFQGKLLFRNEAERERASKAGIEDFDRVYSKQDLARGDLAFVASGVTSGDLLEGVCETPSGTWCQSFVAWTAEGEAGSGSGSAAGGAGQGGGALRAVVERVQSRTILRG